MEQKQNADKFYERTEELFEDCQGRLGRHRPVADASGKGKLWAPGETSSQPLDDWSRRRTERTPQLHFGLGATPQQTDGKKTDEKHSQRGRRRVRSDEGAAENWEEEDEEKASPIVKRGGKRSSTSAQRRKRKVTWVPATAR